MKSVVVGLAALALAGCASTPPPPHGGERRDVRCAMGCAHYHWDEAGRYDRLYDPVYVDEYGYGQGYEGAYGYRYQGGRSYEREGSGYEGYGYGDHPYAPPPPPAYPPPPYDEPYGHGGGPH